MPICIVHQVFAAIYITWLKSKHLPPFHRQLSLTPHQYSMSPTSHRHITAIPLTLYRHWCQPSNNQGYQPTQLADTISWVLADIWVTLVLFSEILEQVLTQIPWSLVFGPAPPWKRGPVSFLRWYWRISGESPLADSQSTVDWPSTDSRLTVDRQSTDSHSTVGRLSADRSTDCWSTVGRQSVDLSVDSLPTGG